MSEANSDMRSYYQDGATWEKDIVRKAKLSRNLAWLVALIMMGLVALGLVILMMMVPLKSFEVVVVEVDKNTGYIETKRALTDMEDIPARRAVEQAYVVSYVRNREGYDPFAIEEKFGMASLLSTGKAASDLRDQWSATSRNNPGKVFGKNTRVLVDIKSVTFPNDSTALVRFSTEERTATDRVMHDYISVVRFRLTGQPRENKWLFDNPLGFQVYDYRRDQETVGAQGGGT